MTLFNGKTDDQKVLDVFKIDEEKLEAIGQVNAYWKNSFGFYNQVKNMPYLQMTHKQVDWLTSIEEEHDDAYLRYC